MRTEDLYHHIDAGFINLRKCFSVFGKKCMDVYEANRKPGDGPFEKQFNNYLLVDLALTFCRTTGVSTLGEVLQKPRPGELFCSTELLEGNKDVYSASRIRNRVLLPYEYDRSVFLEFGTGHFVADTGQYEQSYTERVSVIGQIRRCDAAEIIAHPLVMGAPTLDHQKNWESEVPTELRLRYSYDWYEVFAEDIDEFCWCKDLPPTGPDEWMEYMRELPEEAVKKKLCELLDDIPKKDWGGEQADHYSASVHLAGKRTTAAFVLKGPAQFKEMTPALLGKQADQIYRLAQTPAQLLVVQHCHEIAESVRATLRAFAVAPHQPRRYCLIDGRDTYRILKAYRKLQAPTAASSKEQS